MLAIRQCERPAERSLELSRWRRSTNSGAFTTPERSRRLKIRSAPSPRTSTGPAQGFRRIASTRSCGIYAPLLQLAFINGVGPRVGESGFGLIPGFADIAPFEDITLKSS